MDYLDDSSGFAMLTYKKQKLFPLLKQYDFTSAIIAIFAITSWRNNRGAQESCLALNAIVSDNIIWGNKLINTYEEFALFFEEIYPILQITEYDDPVLIDFGEVKLCYKSKYYSVITGTGHTSPIFAALQFLESVSNAECMDLFSDDILNYSNNMLVFLSENNASINDDFSLSPRFECPSMDYFISVQRFFENKMWESLPDPLLRILSTSNNTIVKSHFTLKNGTNYPLFNPSLIIDYFTNIVVKLPEKSIAKIIKYSLIEKIKKIYCYNGNYSARLIENVYF